jgi:hypothetical protein
VRDTGWRGREASIAVWEHWKACAAARGWPMRTCGDIVDFMTELGVLERVERGRPRVLL